MKQTDFGRLKAICEKEGFEIGFKYDESTYTVGLKKDIWEGVEFVDCVSSWCINYIKGKIYKLVDKPLDRLIFIDNEGTKTNICDYTEAFTNEGNNTFKPSTESEYIEQLKDECFKRFGEINEGDRFDLCFSEGKIKTTYKISSNTVFNYEKPNDALRVGGLKIYEQGKWATRVEENVEVEGVNFEIKRNGFFMTQFFINKERIKFDELECINFLASKLEEYLNKE